MSTDNPAQPPRREQAGATRELLLRTAERLYAELGLAQVSNRQIVDAAGQANNSALTYHVGTRADLIRAITRSHTDPIACHTWRMAEETRGSTDPRDHVAALVLPYTRHLADLGTPSWFARYGPQISTDPALADNARADLIRVPQFQEGLAAVWAHVTDIPAREVALREQAMRLTVIHTCAEQERTAAETGTPADWTLVGEALVDAVTGLLLAPRRAQVANST
ncbi:TetR family transcriptional regulator [Umezawaea sp. Da 62-37]|uniref:TetR/AcrR family transcriptional regulator n=1 Tax=Umezawaea sp. Da 62-37 TaxID=3075927 RepID=UPI0028F6F91D|nr:TetR family transcriptional regulator [Umezawaea sp. Da 62-37]WNV88254.1 TetR family transcriptional regulator [Umezawaea sp. Da 62-37]